MALVLADRVQETTTTTGTGTVTLSGAVSGFQSFSAIGNGNTTYYTIADQTGTNWEVGLGTYTASGTTLSRDSVLSSSNSGSLVNFGAGTKNVFVTYPASKAVYNGGALGTPSSGTATNLTGLPLSTGVTGQLAIANGGTGQSTQTAAFDALAPTTTKGDLVVYNGTDNVRLGVGTNNYVLTADSAQTAGVKWAAVPSASPGGSDTQVQFNDSGSFGGDAGLTYNKTTDTLTTSVVVHGAGTASAPSITTTGDTNTGLYFPAADTAAITTVGTERMRIDSDGNVGIGSTSPSTYGDSGGGPNIVVQSTGAGRGVLVFASQQTGGADELLGKINFIDSDSTNTAFRGAGILGVRGSDANSAYLLFNTANSGNGAERMRINAAGYLLVGYTSSNGSYNLQVNSQIFATSATIATSDGRYKENVTPLTGALDIVKALNPVQFTWKQHPVHNFDRSCPTVGFIAQEVQQVLADKPYLNSIIKANECTIQEEVKDEEGNVVTPAVKEDFYGIAEGNMIAILTKALQEAIGEIETLKTKVAALEAKGA